MRSIALDAALALSRRLRMLVFAFLAVFAMKVGAAALTGAADGVPPRDTSEQAGTERAEAEILEPASKIAPTAGSS